jgi:hypothetical protein
VSRKNEGPRIVWSYKKQELRLAERTDGMWLILSTDETRDANEAVNEYLEKDFIEKVFRVLKTQEEVEPVRHRLEHRVRAYLFVCMLAYRLLSVLQWKLKEASGQEDSWERADTLLQALGRVERVGVTFGNETKTWYLNGYIPVIVELKKAIGDLRGKQILDHGCGAGKITRLSKLFYSAEVPGIDLSDNMIQEVRKADPDGRYELLTEDILWPDSTLDGAMSNWVFVDIGSV